MDNRYTYIKKNIQFLFQCQTIIFLRHYNINNQKKILFELLYMRMDCRNIKTLLSVNQAELWKDITVVISNDIISENYHHIATIKKANRNMTREPNPKLKPGDVICLDIIRNTSRASLTPSTMYTYFLLAVDTYSRMPQIKGLYGVSTSEIIDALKFIQV